MLHADGSRRWRGLEPRMVRLTSARENWAGTSQLNSQGTAITLILILIVRMLLTLLVDMRDSCFHVGVDGVTLAFSVGMAEGTTELWN